VSRRVREPPPVGKPVVSAAGGLHVADLVVEYSSGGYVVRPINGVSLDVAAGELVLVLGASGCGKTSLLSVLAAILTPKSGTVRLGTTEVTTLIGPALAHYRRHEVGVVFQAFNLIPSLTALENVQVPLRVAGIRGRAARERARGLIDQVGMADRMHHRPGDLSGGEQQRVAIARALAHDPPMLLADEPTAHLDYIQVEGVLRLLRSLADQGHIVVVATHDERILPLADRVVAMTAVPASESAPPERVELASGQMLFEQGDRGHLVYVVEEGEVEVVRVRSDGSEEVRARIGPGRYFGELAPLFGLPRSASARATSPTVLTSYTLRDFRSRFQPGPVAEVLARAAD
jgi:putative ABC transport system ATP-binding protein